MARKLNREKIRKILEILRKYPDGIWFRQLVRESGLAPSTVYFYLKKLGGAVENLGYVDEEGRFVGVRIIRLKRDLL